MSKTTMKRGEAEKLIDDIRAALVLPMHGTTPQESIEAIFRRAGIEPLKVCTGEAHSNAFIDNCYTCAPRWGTVGTRIKVT